MRFLGLICGAVQGTRGAGCQGLTHQPCSLWPLTSAWKGHFSRSPRALRSLQALILSGFCSYSLAPVHGAEHAIALVGSRYPLCGCFELQDNTWEGEIWRCGWWCVDNRPLNTQSWFWASFLPYIISTRWLFSPYSAANRPTWLYRTSRQEG